MLHAYYIIVYRIYNFNTSQKSPYHCMFLLYSQKFDVISTQSLHENIRLDYCNLWMSLINGDNEGLKKYSTRLGVAGMYPLLACVLTGRSWNSLKSGLNAKYSDREVRSQSIAKFIAI